MWKTFLFSHNQKRKNQKINYLLGTRMGKKHPEKKIGTLEDKKAI
jgi:hypothetical protein